MRWLKASKGYILKRNVWGHLSGFSGVRASSSWNNDTFRGRNYFERVKNGAYLLFRYCVPNSCRQEINFFELFNTAGECAWWKDAKMEMKKVLAGWSKICPGCNIGRKYPDSFIGKKVRNHWEKGCMSHNAYVEVYGSDEPSPNKSKVTSDDKWICD